MEVKKKKKRKGGWINLLYEYSRIRKDWFPGNTREHVDFPWDLDMKRVPRSFTMVHLQATT